MEQVKLEKTLTQQIEEIYDQINEQLGIVQDPIVTELVDFSEMYGILNDLKLAHKGFKFDFFDGEHFRYSRKFGKNKTHEALIYLFAKDDLDPYEDGYYLLTKVNMADLILILFNTITLECRRLKLKLS